MPMIRVSPVFRCLALMSLILALNASALSADSHSVLDKMRNLITPDSLTAYAERIAEEPETCRRADARSRLACAFANGNSEGLRVEEVRGFLATSLRLIRLEPNSPDISLHYLIAAASALFIFQAESHADPSIAKRLEALGVADETWDQLLEYSIPSSDPLVLQKVIYAYSEAFLISHELGESPVSQTKWLTNLASSHARRARVSPKRDAVAHLQRSAAIRHGVVDLLEDADDPVRLARALHNLGNVYLQAGELVGAEREEGQNYAAKSAPYYDRSINILLADELANDAVANRLLTVGVASRAMSLPRIGGDSLFAHRRAIAMVKHLREKLSHRVSPEREPTLALSELNLRSQLIHLLANDAQKLNQVNEALGIFEGAGRAASQRRREADTAIFFNSIGTLLYAVRGTLAGNPEDCLRADDHWDRVRRSSGRFPSIFSSPVAELPLVRLIECHVANDPALAADTGPGHEIAKIRRKRELKSRYREELPILSETPPLFPHDIEREIVNEAGGELCKASVLLTEAFSLEVIRETPDFWDLWVHGFSCGDDKPGFRSFFEFAAGLLLAQERSEAQTRSGVALLARRLRQPLTDFAIALLEHEKPFEALWTLDFRDRSRDTRRLGLARGMLEKASEEARANITRDIEDWLRHDNPLDLEMSYVAVSTEDASMQLRSEVAAKRLNIGGTTADFPTVEEVANLAAGLEGSRRVAWLLIGTHRSGWLILQAGGGKPEFAYVPLDFAREDLLALLNRRFHDPSESDGPPHQTFFEIREAEGRDPANVRLWQIALADISRDISDRLLQPLMAELASHRSEPGAQPLTLVVRNELADFPFHAIAVSQAPPDCGPALIDCFLVSYAGDLSALRDSTVLESGAEARIDVFWGFSEVSEEDPNSLSVYGNVLGRNPAFSVRTEDSEAFESLAGAPYGLWLVHGRYDADNASVSAFSLSNAESLTPIDIVSRAPGPAGRRLQILVGCDGALFDTKVQPTEQIGLAEPFFHIGIPAVIVPGWDVEQVASLVFTAKVSEELVSGASPAQAYRGAVLFLREARPKDVFDLLDADRNWLKTSRVYRVLTELYQEERRGNGESEAPSLFADLTRFGAFKLVEGGAFRLAEQDA